MRKLISYTSITSLILQNIVCLSSASAWTGRPSTERAPLLHPEFASLEFGGQPYQYYERKNKAGKVYAQYLLGKDRTEIMLDNDGDGTLDSWEIFTKNGKILMSNPHKGHFRHMDMDVMIPKGIVTYRYAWNEKTRLYVLYSSRARPYTKYSYQAEMIVNCLAGDAGTKLEQLSESLNTALNSGQRIDELQSNLMNQTLDSSCKTGAFKDAANDIVAGMMKVATSEKSGTWNKMKADDEARPQERGMYLQCMRHYGLFAQAARIESAMAQYTSLVPSDKYLWKMTCSTQALAENGNFVEGQASTPPQIEIHATEAQIKTYLKNPAATTDQIQGGYARIFFHEMQHYSMMSESDAHLVENCCAEPTEGAAKESACKSLQDRTNLVRYKQGYENIIEDSLGADGNAVLHDTLNQSFGDNDAEDYYNDTLGELSQIYNKYSTSSACQTNKSEENPLGNCEKQYKAEVKTLLDGRFEAKDSVCIKSIDPKLKSQAQAICSTTGEILESVINKTGAPCGKAIQQDKTALKDFDVLKLFAYFVRSETATADPSYSGTAQQRLCSVAQSMKIDAKDGVDNLGMSSYDFDPILKPQAPGIATSTLSPGETNNSLKPSSASGKTSYNAGPERPIFSNDSTARSKEIANHISNSDSLINNFQSYATRSANAIVPRAQAEPAGQLGTTTVREADVHTTYVPQASRVAVPDPTGSLGASGPGGAAIPSRAPASVGSNGFGPTQAAAVGAGAGQGARYVSRSQGTNHLSHMPGMPGVSGLANAKASEGGKKNAVNLAEERALKALLLFLKNKDYENKVKPELVRPSIQAALLDHKVQVVDEDGKVFGSGFPIAKLVYSSEKRQLVDAPASGR